MSLNFLPERRASQTRTLGIGTGSLALASLPERLDWARENGFRGIEIAATGRPRDLHAPAVRQEDRERLRQAVSAFDAVAIQAPYQEVFDVTLLSPSSSIRRASVAEIWACFRLVEALGGGVVTIRTGWPPEGVDQDRQREFLAECLGTLDRMAGDHNATVGVLTSDYFRFGERLELLEMLPLRHTGITLHTSLSALLFRHGRTMSAPVENGETLIQRFAPRLVHVQLSDFDNESDGLALGQGRLDIAGIAHALQTVHYQGMVCFDFDPDRVTPEQAAASKALWERAASDVVSN